VKFKSGGLLNRLVAIEVCGLKPKEIEWIYLVELLRIDGEHVRCPKCEKNSVYMTGEKA
jgi:hypothetical protein